MTVVTFELANEPLISPDIKNRSFCLRKKKNRHQQKFNLWRDVVNELIEKIKSYAISACWKHQLRPLFQ